MHALRACARLLALACSAAPAGSLAAPTPVVHTVVIEGMLFTPARLTVRQGDTIIWKNRDAFPHTATSEGKGFDSKDIGPERSWKMVANRRGSFPYLCTLHRTMRGTLRVR